MSQFPLIDVPRPLTQRLPPTIREREILRVAASLVGPAPQQSAELARHKVLQWAQKQSGSNLPPEAWSQQSFDHLAGGRNCYGIRICSDNTDIWTLRSDRPDTDIAQRVWTTEITIGVFETQMPRIGVRSLVSSPEIDLLIEPAVPKFLREIAKQCVLKRREQDLTDVPWVIDSDKDADTLLNLLVNPERDLPVFVLTVPEDVGESKPLLDADTIARATIGIASVVILPARFTWALTDRLGKRLSVFGGAVRVYLPGFSEDANPHDGHDLVLAEHLASPEGPARVSAWMRRLAANESLKRYRLGQDVLSFAAIREQSLDLASVRLKQEGASDTAQLLAANTQINALKDDLAKALATQQWLSDEHTAAEDRAKAAETLLTTAGFRIQQLTDQLKARGDTPDANIPLPTDWNDFSDWCEKHLVGRVLLSPRARREVRAPLYRDVSTAAKCLLWLANQYRERRLAGGDGDLRIPLESGIQNDQCGADSFQFDWRGRRTDVEWHIKTGGNTRDPSRCLRIYYFWDDANQQVIVASMPAHIHTGAT